jgi:anti-sigma factor RsiW
MTCERLEELRDYAMGELGAAERETMERHVAGCGDCSAELSSLQLTTAALRSLPDREVPQRIAFVSDKVFAPSPVAAWFGSFWNSAARLGFASACLLAGAIVFSVVERPAAAPVTTANVIQTGVSQADVDRAVKTAVAQVKAEDEKATAAILAAADQKHEKEHRALLVAMDENMTVLQKRLSTYTMLAANDERFGARP